MKIIRKLTMAALFATLACAGALGCGGSDNNAVNFTIFPSTATVQRGATFQFDTNPSGLLNVNWSVVGGAANGSIDDDGLYTAPDAIPVENAVTIEAELDGVTATGTVTLVAADALAFDSPEQINDTSFPTGLLLFSIIGTGVSDQIGAGLGSVHVYSSWTTGAVGPVFDVAFADALDLAPFSAEENLTNNGISLLTSLFVDQNLNPGILYATGAGTGALSFLGSTNQGASFNPPVPIVSPASGNVELLGNSAVDQSNVYHIVYIEQAATNVVRYSESSNGGGSWSAPLSVSVSADDQTFPQIATSQDGQDLAVCYTEDVAGTNNDIFVALSNNGGTSFTATNITNTAGLDEFFCNIALGPNGEIYVSYNPGSGATAEIIFQSSTNGGASFNPPVTVNSTTAGAQLFPFMSLDDQGRLDFIWSDGNGGTSPVQLMYARSIDGGVTFSPNNPIVPAGAATTVVGMGLVHDESGRLHIQFQTDAGDPGNNSDVFYIFGQ